MPALFWPSLPETWQQPGDGCVNISMDCTVITPPLIDILFSLELGTHKLICFFICLVFYYWSPYSLTKLDILSVCSSASGNLCFVFTFSLEGRPPGPAANLSPPFIVIWGVLRVPSLLSSLPFLSPFTLSLWRGVTSSIFQRKGTWEAKVLRSCRTDNIFGFYSWLMFWLNLKF